VRLQIMGFCWVFVIFLVCAIAYNDLVKPQYIQAFQVRARSLLDCYVLACLTACRPEVLSLVRARAVPVLLLVLLGPVRSGAPPPCLCCPCKAMCLGSGLDHCRVAPAVVDGSVAALPRTTACKHCCRRAERIAAAARLTRTGNHVQNATTWMLPGEIFPTEVRATCHGISAATGKAGALVAGIWFAYLTPAGRFYVSAFFNLAGLLLTALFVRARPCTLRPGLAFQPGANVFAASRCWMHARCVDNAVLQMR